MSFFKKSSKKEKKKKCSLKEENLSPKEKLSPKLRKKQSFQKLPNPLDELTEDEMDVLEKFQKNINDMTEEEKMFCTITTLIRYLRARDFNLDLSETLLRDTLKWREEFKPHEITASEMETEAKMGKIYIPGFDKYGRPIVVMRPSRETGASSYDVQLKYLVYMLERACNLMSEGVHQLIWLIDFSDFSTSGAPPISQCIETLKILANHFPERLAHCFFMDTPWLFKFFWATISAFVNQKTADKVIIVTSSSSQEDKQQTMSKYFDLDFLEKGFGGNSDYVFDSDEYFATLTEEDERIKAKWERKLKKTLSKEKIESKVL
eukprot:gene1901-1041_t